MLKKKLSCIFVALLLCMLCLSASAEVNKDFCIHMQKLNGIGYLYNIDGILYGFEEKDGITARIGRYASASSEMTEIMSPFVSENEKVIYFEISAFDTETETVVDYTEKVSMEAVVFKPEGSGFTSAMGKDYRVYKISDTANELTVTDSDLYEFSFETDTFGTYAVVYNPNAITLTFYDGESIYHTIENLATTDEITLPEKPQNKDIDGTEYEFCGWYSREDGQGLRLYDGVDLYSIGAGSVFAYWQPEGNPHIASLELLDDPEADDDIAGSLYGYRETDETTVKLIRFSETSETGQVLAELFANRVEEGQKAMFFGLVEYDKASGEIIGYLDDTTLGVTISLASEGILGKDYKVYKIISESAYQAASVTESDTISFTFLTEGLGIFAVIYDTRIVSVDFYDGEALHNSQPLSLDEFISLPEAPVKEGYTFEGWYSEKDGKGIKLEEGMTYLELESDVVYAYWVKKSPDIYKISTVDDFNAYASLIISDNENYGGAVYVLENDLDAKGIYLTPFGTEEAPFCGTFDGNGKKILNVTFEDVKYSGVIGYMNGGTVKNLFVLYNDTSSRTYTSCTRFGGIVGVIDTAGQSDIQIYNCKISGNVKISTQGFMRYGGIFSDLRADAGNVKINDCVTFCNADIESGKTGYVGGLGGYAYSTNTSIYDYAIENCISYGNVSLNSSATSSYAAGFVAYTFRNDPSYIDGIDGSDIFSTASIFADASNYLNCVSFGNLSVTATKNAYYGAFVGGANEFVSFDNCYVSSEKELTGTVLCEVDVTSKTPDEMNTIEFLTNTLMLDAENVWCINSAGCADLKMFEENPITITLGDNLPEGHTRYVEVNGIQTEMESGTYIVPEGEGNLLIEITEKDAEGSVVDAGYYFVDRSARTVEKLLFGPFMSASEKNSIRTKNPMGIRFKAQIRTSAKFEETEYVIDEYGFVVSRKDILGENELTLDTEVKVTGVGYNKAQNIDVVFEQNDEYHTFTGVVRNIPVKHYKTDLVCKTYTKISVDGEQFVVYGEPVVGNVYDTAKKLLETNPDNADLIKIVLDYEGTIGITLDNLYGE